MSDLVCCWLVVVGPAADVDAFWTRSNVPSVFDPESSVWDFSGLLPPPSACTTPYEWMQDHWGTNRSASGVKVCAWG